MCGGDGTCTWIMQALTACKARGALTVQPPIAIAPLGTGNDLARSLGWGPNFTNVRDIPATIEMM